MLPYVRIIAVHIIPNAFTISNIRDSPIDRPQLVVSCNKAMGRPLENIPYVSIGSPGSLAASFKDRYWPVLA